MGFNVFLIVFNCFFLNGFVKASKKLLFKGFQWLLIVCLIVFNCLLMGL